MALTIATGFVVDDAIVVLENVTRHVEAGMDRFEAALLGAKEVGFTVLSISHLADRGLHPHPADGRDRRAAVPRVRHHPVGGDPRLAADLADHHADDVRLPGAARPGTTSNAGTAGALVGERRSTGCRRRYEHALDWVLDAGPLMLVALAATVVLTGYLYTIVPKGFFPQQDTGLLMGGLQADQSSSFAISSKRIRQFVGIVRSDPSVQTVVAFAGNNAAGGFLITGLKPRNERKGGSAAVVQRLRPKLARVTGASLFLNPAQDLRIGGRQGNATYQYTLEGPDLTVLRQWAGKLAEALKADPALVDVNTDQEDHGLESFITIDRDAAARLGITNSAIDNTLYDAFGQRQVSTIYKETNQYKVVMEAAPGLHRRSDRAQRHLRQQRNRGDRDRSAARPRPPARSAPPARRSWSVPAGRRRLRLAALATSSSSGGGSVAGQPGGLAAGTARPWRWARRRSPVPPRRPAARGEPGGGGQHRPPNASFPSPPSPSWPTPRRRRR